MSSDEIKTVLLSYARAFKDHTEKQIKRISKKKVDQNVIRIFKSTITDEKWLVISYDGDDEDYSMFPFAETANEWTAYVQHSQDNIDSDEEAVVIMFAPNWWKVKERYFYDQHLEFVFGDILKAFIQDEYEEIQENTFISNIGNLEETIADLKNRGFNVEMFDENTLP
jgi:hypothetical protein